jgi:hypothetical protein
MAGRVLPFRRPDPPPEDAGAFDEVARAGDQAEALVLQSLLEAYGIRVILRTHLAQSVHPFAVGGQGEVRLLVPRASAAESRLLLARLSPGPSAP